MNQFHQSMVKENAVKYGTIRWKYVQIELLKEKYKAQIELYFQAEKGKWLLKLTMKLQKSC